MLASAARLRYAHQIPNARGELQVFRSKLLELAFQWDQSKLVKTILTLVRPATRSGRGYGFIPPEDDFTCTAKAPNSFYESITGWFPKYHPPSFLQSKQVSTRKLSFKLSCGVYQVRRKKNTRKLSFIMSGGVCQVRRKKMRISLAVVSEDQELRGP